MPEIIKPTDESALHKIKDIDVTKYIDAFAEYRAARETFDMKIIENEVNQSSSYQIFFKLLLLQLPCHIFFQSMSKLFLTFLLSLIYPEPILT